jgi:hypothetical protein
MCEYKLYTLDGLSRVAGPPQLIVAETAEEAIRSAEGSEIERYELWRASELIAARKPPRRRTLSISAG